MSAPARGRKAGRALVEALVQRARTVEGLEQLVLSVAMTQQAARALYLALGFEPYGYERRALKLGDQYVDEEHMVLWLR